MIAYLYAMWLIFEGLVIVAREVFLKKISFTKSKQNWIGDYFKKDGSMKEVSISPKKNMVLAVYKIG